MHFEANVVYIDIILRFLEYFGVTVQYLYCFQIKPVCFSFSCDGNAKEICIVSSSDHLQMHVMAMHDYVKLCAAQTTEVCDIFICRMLQYVFHLHIP